MLNIKDKEKTRKKVMEMSLKAIKENESFVFFDDLIKYLNISSQSWYALFPKTERDDIPEWNAINDALNMNRVGIKGEIREKMLESKSPAALIALYRLVGTQEEREALNMRMDEKKSSDGDDKTTNIKLEIK